MKRDSPTQSVGHSDVSYTLQSVIGRREKLISRSALLSLTIRRLKYLKSALDTRRADRKVARESHEHSVIAGLDRTANDG